MPRFVILHHRTPPHYERPTHWDFMLEQEERLRTWALAEQPRVDRAIEAEQLPDHRAAYLDYEGPVSNDRGTVAQWDAGQYRLLSESEERIVVELQGRRLSGRAALDRSTEAPQRWKMRIFGG